MAIEDGLLGLDVEAEEVEISNKPLAIAVFYSRKSQP
jgi:hypothetical protein